MCEGCGGRGETGELMIGLAVGCVLAFGSGCEDSVWDARDGEGD